MRQVNLSFPACEAHTIFSRWGECSEKGDKGGKGVTHAFTHTLSVAIVFRLHVYRIAVYIIAYRYVRVHHTVCMRHSKTSQNNDAVVQLQLLYYLIQTSKQHAPFIMMYKCCGLSTFIQATVESIPVNPFMPSVLASLFQYGTITTSSFCFNNSKPKCHVIKHIENCSGGF